jgi:hypothetical protein
MGGAAGLVNEWFPVLNTALSCAILVYAVRVEHRLTKLETQVAFMIGERLQQWSK